MIIRTDKMRIRRLAGFTMVVFLLAALLCAQTKPAAWAPTAKQVNSVYPDVEALYLDLHRNPELSLHEQRTAAKLAERAKALGYEVTANVGGTGIVAVLRNGNGPTVMYRTDMDALPVEEKTGLSFASQVTFKNDAGVRFQSCTLAGMTFTWQVGWELRNLWPTTPNTGKARW
jgi:hypothetical protein